MRTRVCPYSLRSDVRVASTGPSWAVALRSLGALLILALLLLPGLSSARDVSPPEPSLVEIPHWDGGACGEDEDTIEELIDCGAGLQARFDEPLAIALLRVSKIRMTARQCEELLADIWAQQRCTMSGRECGKLLAGGIVPTSFDLWSSSASGHPTAAADEPLGAQVRRLGRPADARMPKFRDLAPPVPPPKLELR